MLVKTRYKKFITYSILLHAIIFFLLGYLTELHVFATNEGLENLLDSRPIVFDLQDKKWPKEIVETPEDAKTEEYQKNAELASDKNALARNPETNPDLDLGDAFATGDLNFRELPTNPVPPGEVGTQSDTQNDSDEKKMNDETSDNDDSEYDSMNGSEKFDREYLTQQKKVKNKGAENRLPKVKYDNQNTRAPAMGGLSFNTYDWEFAPYMLALKKKVERNIFPPPAFVRMGIISGETLLRFKIYPRGEVKDLKVLEYKGHKTLMQTSVSAIEISVPFAPLPSNFPEDYLEVTARFNYFVPKRF